MRRAIRAANSGATIREAALDFGVSKSTLHRYLKKNIDDVPDKITSGRFRTLFTKDQEEELVNEIIHLSKRFFAMTRNIVRRLAFNLAEANNLQHPFQNGKAGYDWSYHFLQRHRGRLSVRTAQPLSLQRLFGFRKSAVHLFFDNLEEIILQRGIGPDDIYNCDESGFTIVTSRSPKVFAERGARVVSTIKPVERGRLVSVMACASAAGDFVPPFYVFPGNPSPHQDCKVAMGPNGSKSSNSKKGWMTSEVFMEWMQHFRDHVNPSENHKILLVLDNHSSHVTYEAVQFARENHIDMVTLPPHTSHKLQPLDVGFFSPLKRKFDEAMAVWQNDHRYQKPSELDLPAIMKNPYEETARVDVAKHSFRKTGIWVPFVNGPDRTVFHPDEFLPENDEPIQANQGGNLSENEDGPPGSGSMDLGNDTEEAQIDTGDQCAATDSPHTEVTSLQMFQQPSTSSSNVLGTAWDTYEDNESADLLFFSTVIATEEELRDIQHEESESTIYLAAPHVENPEVSIGTPNLHSESSAHWNCPTNFPSTSAVQLVPYSASPTPERECGDSRRGSNESTSSTELQGLPLIHPDVSSDEGNALQEIRISPSSSSGSTKSAFTVPPHVFRPIEPDAPQATKRQKKSEIATSEDSLTRLKQQKQLKEKKGKPAPKLQSPIRAKKSKNRADALRRSVIATKKSLASQSATRIQPSRLAKK